MQNDSFGGADLTRTYFRCWFRMQQLDLYALWYTNDYQGFWLDSSGRLPAYQRVSELEAFCHAQAIDLFEEEPILHDLDRVLRWSESESEDPDCKEVLKAWNLCNDLRCTILGEEIYSSGLNAGPLYEKVYFGTNPKVFNPNGPPYLPSWTRSEIDELKRIIRNGIAVFVDRLLIIRK